MVKKSITKKGQLSKAKAAITSQGAGRQVFRVKMGGKELALVGRRGSYRAANNPRTRVQTPYGGSADQQADPWSRRIVREICRDMDRNSDTYRTLLDDWVRAVVGKGVRALPRTSNQEWNKKVSELIERDFSATGPGSMDVRERRSWYELQGDFVRAVGGDGDAAVLRLDDGRIQMLESDQITSGLANMSYVGGLTYADGIVMSEAGAPEKYQIAGYDNVSGAINLGKIQDISAEYVDFVALCTRFSQTRGMPLLVAGVESWERLDSYKESEVIAAEQGSLIYGAIEYPVGNMGFGTTYSPGAAQNGNDAQAPTAGFVGGTSPQNNNIDWHETVAGNMMEMPNGAKYVPINPQRPNKDAAPFMIEMLRQFCSNAGLPYEFVFNDLRGLSWSVHRAMVALARDKIAVWQDVKFAPIFNSVYLWKVAQYIQSGEVEALEDWEKFDLLFPKISWPDEGKEFEAQQLGLRAGLTTRHRLFGPDWRLMLDEGMIELEYASDLVTKYNAKYPDFHFTPRELLGLIDHVTEKIDGGDEMKSDGISDSSNVKKPKKEKAKDD